jgi:hypothetical protein
VNLLLVSETLSTWSNPTIVFVIPETVPVNFGESNGAFNANASAKPPISEAVNPATVPLKVAL